MQKNIKLLSLVIILSVVSIILGALFLGGDFKQEEGWVKTYGGVKSDCDSPYGIEEISGNEYLITGTSNSFSSDDEDDILMINTDKDGGVNFAKTFGRDNEDRLHRIQKVDENSFIGVGYISNRPGNDKDKDFLLIRFDNTGKIIWSKALKGEDDQIGYSIIKTSDNNFVAVGWTGKYTGEGQDILAVKVTEDGEVLWAKTLGTNDDEEQSYSVAANNDGGVFILGKKGIERMEALGHSNLLLIKLDENGNITFSKIIGGDVYYYLISPVAINKIGDGYLVAAETYNDATGKDGVFMKLDELGNILWTKIVGTSNNNERFRSIVETKEGNYTAVGESYDYKGSAGLLVEFNKKGEIANSMVFSGGNEGEINRLDFIKESSDSYLISGKTNFYGAGLFDNVIIKISKSYKGLSCNLLEKGINLFKDEIIPKEDSILLIEQNVINSLAFSDVVLEEKNISQEIQDSTLCGFSKEINLKF